MRTLLRCLSLPLLLLIACGGDEVSEPVGSLGDPCAPEGARSGELHCRNGRWQRERTSPGTTTTNPSCISETDAAFCARFEACTLFSGLDNCGRSRTVSCAPLCMTTTTCTGCLIDGACYPQGTKRPGMPCQYCDATQPNQWSREPIDTECDSTLNTPPEVSAGCATSACDAAGACRANAVVRPTSCLIDDLCRSVNASSHENTCRYCDPLQNQRAWSLRPAGTQCSSSAIAECNNNQCQCMSTGECAE